MERLKLGSRLLISSIVVLLGIIAFSCCVAAEFKKLKGKDIEMDGSLCSLPASSAFGLGIASIVCLSIAQIVGTTAAATRLCSRGKKSRRNKIVPITLLLLSWVSFGLAVILLGAGSSMNNGQAYGRGWLDGDCYVVNTGVFVGAAVLDVATVVFILGLLFSTTVVAKHCRTMITNPGDQDRLHIHSEHMGETVGAVAGKMGPEVLERVKEEADQRQQLGAV